MENNTFFDNIEMHIMEEILAAKKEIDLAVAWLTDEQLIKCLQYKHENGVIVKIIVNDDKTNNNVSLKTLSDSGCEIIMAHMNGIMHVKFCIIDDKTVISGSYNWTKNAERNNLEQITITKDNADEVKRFKKQFADMVEKFGSKSKKKASFKGNEIIVPTLYSRIPGNLNYMQLKTLIGILVPLQPYIKARIEKSRNSNFDNIAKDDEISIDRRDINVDGTRIERWYKNSLELINLHYPSMLINEGPVFYENSGTVFSNIYRTKWSSSIHFCFSKGVLSALCSIKYGYFKINISEALAFKKKTSLHLYILLARYNGFNNKVIFTYRDFKLYLGVVNQYKKYSQFKKLVIDPSHDEFLNLFNCEAISFYFDFIPIRRGTRDRGNPDKIEFRLYHR